MHCCSIFYVLKQSSIDFLVAKDNLVMELRFGIHLLSKDLFNGPSV